MSPSSLSLTPTSVEFWYRIIKTSPFHKVIQVFCALIIQIETSSLLLYMRLTYLGLSTMLIPCYKQRINVCWWQCLILLWNISWDIVIGVFNHDIQENIRPHFILPLSPSLSVGAFKSEQILMSLFFSSFNTTMSVKIKAGAKPFTNENRRK